MNEKLQKAITAARNGQAAEAQLLLTQVLTESPHETQAWFLLSTLVDSEQKKKAYLGKVLALEPDHQMAQKMLGRLQEASKDDVDSGAAEGELEETDEMAVSAPVTVSTKPADFLAQEKGETLPEWLIEEEGLEVSELSEAMQVAAVDVAADDTEVDLEIPDWLQDEIPEAWSEEPAVEVAEKVAEQLPEKERVVEPKPKLKSAADSDLAKQQKFLSGILYALIGVTAVIFIIMIYLAWNTFF